MKIALVSTFMLESVMPLSKYLAEAGNDVHLYATVPKYNQNVFVVDFSVDKQSNGFIREDIAIQRMGEKICEYLSGVKKKFFIFPSGFGKKNFLPDIYYAWKLSRHLIKQKFDVINLVHTSDRFSLLIMHFLKDEALVQTLHEVTSHNNKEDIYQIRILKQLIKKNVPVIFHSHISKERFLTFRNAVTNSPVNDNIYAMLRFSLYETYTLFSSGKKNRGGKLTDHEVPVILHFGRVVPYKGIDILVDAIKIIQQYRPVHLIIAGSGKPYFSFDGVKSYEFINRLVDNEEIVDLIEGCTLVVCPYRSASQSGIPMTVYPFNKPIIASSLQGFKEVIDQDKTGLLVDGMDSASYAAAITKLIDDKALRKQMAFNIGEKFKTGEFSWPDIAEETVAFYKKHLNKSRKL